MYRDGSITLHTFETSLIYQNEISRPTTVFCFELNVEFRMV